jgi:hypothetical protein
MVPVVPCPMHRSGPATTHDRADAVAGAHHETAEHHGDSHHGNSARGCNCPGECGRSGAALGLPAQKVVTEPSRVLAHAIVANEQADSASAARLLPFATGPPQRLQV